MTVPDPSHDDADRPNSPLARLAIALAAFAVVAGMLGGGWIGWQTWRSSPGYTQNYVADRGQMVTITLPDADTDADKTVLQLDSATSVNARLYSNRRVMLVEEGRASFDIKPPRDQPFYVLAGAAQVEGTGAIYSVGQAKTGMEAGRTVISVEAGTVTVTSTASPEMMASSSQDAGQDYAPRELSAGQRLTADDKGRLGTTVTLPAGEITAWRQGRIVFKNTPLARAVAEFERYERTGLVVRQPAVGALTVDGTFGVKQSREFAAALPGMLPVRLQRQGDVTEIMAR
ncbi:FecR family protein [Pigmentiphaga litoralis]|uniref:FecR family protein n=1 Tax=Pigmentiphaga litoralis TaxID=516702 RepID=UPI003B42A823